MQLIWVASPTSKIRKFNITHKQLIRLALVFSLLFMAAGSAFYFIGFRLAIKVKPAIAQTLGGVVTIEEQHEIEEQYRSKLDELHTHLNTVEQLVADLQTEKERLAKIATPTVVASKLTSVAGSGGPLLLPKSNKQNSTNLFDNLDEVIERSKNFEDSVKSLDRQWDREINLLQNLPTKSPVDAPAHSNFGNRIDPINGRLAFHSGIDFPAPPGTKVYATGDGKISKISSDSGYGLFIEAKHAIGISSKYAHLSKTLVQEGDTIYRGQLIGLVGSSGRSTGPHLHYEITVDHNFHNPNEFIVTKHHQNISESGTNANLD